MKQKESYKTWHPVTKFDIWFKGYKIFVNGIEQNLFDTYKRNDAGFIDYLDDAEILIWHECRKLKSRSKFIKPVECFRPHPKGELGGCKYMMLSGIPLHRFLYIWFYDDLDPENDICHVDHNSLNNKLSNLKQDSHKKNLSQREGSINQYGKRKKDRLN